MKKTGDRKTTPKGYVMRLKHVPEAAGILAESPWFIEEPEAHKGHWDRVFCNENPIFIEVGTGKGQFIVESARRFPEKNFIGIEIYESVLYKAAKKLSSLGEEAPKNLRLLCVDARRLGDIFEKAEVSGIFANFSDPWPRRRHAKRRLTSPGFIAIYEKVLKPGGHIEFKTDNRGLFDYSLQSFEEAEDWELYDVTFDLHAQKPQENENIQTEYEMKFSAEGKPIHKLCARFLSIVLSFLLVAAFPGEALAKNKTWPSGIDTESKSMVVMDVDSGAVLLDKSPEEKKYPASITKILTGLLAVENSKPDETVVFSEDAVFLNEGDSSHISRDVGERMTMEECLYGMMLESANECAWAIAEHVAGTEEKFVDMMNERAAKLGCTNTHFSNPNGLPEEDHYTSALDMARIAREAYKNERLRAIMATRAYTIPPTNTHDVETPLNNHHAMLNFYKTDEYLYDGCLGGKTGYTDTAGYTLVTYAKRDGLTLICVVMDSNSPGYYNDTIKLFDYAFSNFVVYTVAEAGGLSGAVRRDAGALMDETDLFSVGDDAKIVLPRTASVLDCSVSVLPIKGGEEGTVGMLQYDYSGRYVGGGTLRFAAMGMDMAYPFRNQKEEKDENTAYIYVDFLLIARVLAAAVSAAAALLLIRALAVKLSKSRRHRREQLEEEKPKYTLIRYNGRKRKR